MTIAQKLKKHLKLKAIEVAVFDSARNDNTTAKFISLEDAIKSVDEFEILFSSPPCENFYTKKRLKVLDIETQTVHNLVSIDYDANRVVMESEEYGRTGNSIDKVNIIAEK